MSDFVETLIAAVVVGSLYALIALGYTMVYGILKIINFAHSDVVVWGAWISYVLAQRLLPAFGFDPHHPQPPPPLWMAAVILIGAMFACALLGLAIERLAYRPLRHAPRLNVLITAIGVSLLLQNVGQLNFVFGANPAAMPGLLPQWSLTIPALGRGAAAHPVTVDLIDLIICGTATVLVLALEGLVFHTKLGIAMRAVSFNSETASLLGINVDRVISLTFVLGSSLAAAAGFLHAMKYPGLNQPAHQTWVLLGLKGFVAAVVGGIGNVRGAVLGGLVIAFVEQFGAHYASPDFRDVYVFGLLIAILLIRPTGLLGTSVVEKV
ncbi:MAG TPA: branched-chain amino acid ABC transporter permease [Planctomycetaceae bacterium]|nr:branched-chain amino acid ABC transporter permease [Planctomycetaceae bacterium]